MSTDAAPTPALDEQSVALTRDFRLLQKRRGHRYSVDDMLVAHLAATHLIACRRTPQRVLDLGCGLGAVLLITAWAFADATLVGIEALAEHVAFARRNLRLNGCAGRARIVEGDLRDRAQLEELGRFDLVTGSPPYFAVGSGTPCADPARAAAHFELRGGIEAYAAAARVALAPGGRFVTCAPASPPGRSDEALARAGLHLCTHREVIPRLGKPAFLRLLVAAREPGAAPVEDTPLILRQDDGHRSPEHRAIRRWTGL